MQCEPLRIRLTATTNANTAVNIDTERIAPENYAEIAHLALMNRSGESVTVQFGIVDMVGFEQIYAKQTVADGDAFGVPVEFCIIEGDKLRAVVTGTADHSTITFIVSGKLYTPDPETDDPPAPPNAPPRATY